MQIKCKGGRCRKVKLIGESVEEEEVVLICRILSPPPPGADSSVWKIEIKADMTPTLVVDLSSSESEVE